MHTSQILLVCQFLFQPQKLFIHLAPNLSLFLLCQLCHKPNELVKQLDELVEMMNNEFMTSKLEWIFRYQLAIVGSIQIVADKQRLGYKTLIVQLKHWNCAIFIYIANKPFRLQGSQLDVDRLIAVCQLGFVCLYRRKDKDETGFII